MKTICTCMIVCALSAPLFAASETVNGITWQYSITNGEATIESGRTGTAAVPTDISGQIVIPETLGGVPVTQIGNYAFYGCSSLRSVVIPEGVTTIGWSAFQGCSSLTEVVIPEGVTEIGSSAFSGCSALTEVVIPESVTEIGGYAFSGCSSLTEVVLPEGVTEIGEQAFSGCSSLTSVSIPEGVTSIEEWAFYGCSSLTEVVIPEGVTEIGQAAFKGCSALTEMVIPEGVTSIGDNAFSGCSSLTSVVIPEGVTSIGSSTFQGCSALTEVVIPEGVTSIGGYAFYYCSSLTSVVIPESVTEIGGSAFSDCSSLTEVVIPESVTEIGGSAFSDCSSLTEVVFEGGVPKGFASSGLPGKSISFQQEYGAEWELAVSGNNRLTVVDVLVPERVKVEARAETPTSKTIKVTYTVRSELPSVKVRAVAFKDGVRSFANIVPMRTGEGVPRGESVTTNEEHTFVWEVASDWATNLDKVAVEILVQEGTLLPQERIIIPATKSHKAMTITRNVLAEPWLFDALVWCYAEGDPRLVVSDGQVSVDGTEIAREGKLPDDRYWLQDIGGSSWDYNWHKKATVLLNYLYGKMGYKVLAGEDLEYAEQATRLDFADAVDYETSQALRQVSVKIEEGE